MFLPPNIRLLRLQPLDLHLLHLALAAHLVRKHDTVLGHQLRHLPDAAHDVASTMGEIVELRLEGGDQVMRLRLIGCHGQGLGDV